MDAGFRTRLHGGVKTTACQAVPASLFPPRFQEDRESPSVVMSREPQQKIAKK